MPDVVLRLPAELRDELKDPRGPVYTATDVLLDEAGEPLVAIGDVVTHHLLEAGHRPALAVVDGRTKREPAAHPVASVADADEADVTLENPPATLTAELLEALREGLAGDDPVRVLVDGEEDLAAVPVSAIAPDRASVVDGQPGAGMVHVAVTAAVRSWARDFLSRMDGDVERARSLLGY